MRDWRYECPKCGQMWAPGMGSHRCRDGTYPVINAYQLEKQPPKTKESDARCPHPDQPTPSAQDTGTPTLSDDAQLRPDAELADRRRRDKAKPYRLPFLPR